MVDVPFSSTTDEALLKLLKSLSPSASPLFIAPSVAWSGPARAFFFAFSRASRRAFASFSHSRPRPIHSLPRESLIIVKTSFAVRHGRSYTSRWRWIPATAVLTWFCKSSSFSRWSLWIALVVIRSRSKSSTIPPSKRSCTSSAALS